MKETLRRKKSALRTMLEMMDVPEMRMDLDRPANIRWLHRNLAINNSAHPLFETAKELVGWIMTFNAGQAMLTRKRPVC
tara:strand:+ start:175 stop:411 length:237 start_codon:yes stop_codon:yes gene_type:complete